MQMMTRAAGSSPSQTASTGWRAGLSNPKARTREGSVDFPSRAPRCAETLQPASGKSRHVIPATTEIVQQGRRSRSVTPMFSQCRQDCQASRREVHFPGQARGRIAQQFAVSDVAGAAACRR